MSKDSDLSQNIIDISYKNIEPYVWMGDVHTFCQKLLMYLGKENWEVSLLFCDDSFISELNEKYRIKTGPTDILTFPQISDETGIPLNSRSPKIYAGDIVISIPSLLRNAFDQHSNREEELKRLIIHGVLHLSGMVHKEDRCEMIMLQEKLLKELMGG